MTHHDSHSLVTGTDLQSLERLYLGKPGSDFGVDEGVVFMTMEYLHGHPLSAAARRSWKEERSFPAWLVARAVADAARGLHAAHELVDAEGRSYEIVHRDVSPENILVSYDGLSKVIDFGVVAGRGRKTETKVGTVKGKLSHMAPEQLEGRDVDRRADVWSLGVVLWESTLGRRLFRGEAPGETVTKVATMRIPRPSEVAPGYPPMLQKIVMDALERDLERRTPSAEILAHQLEGWLHSLGRPAGHAEVARWMRETFSDRLMVREALLTAPDDERASITPEPLSEGSSSHLISGSIASSSFAPPPVPTGITKVERPEAKRAAEAAPGPDPAELDREVEALRRQGARRRAIVWVLVAIVLGLAGAVAYLLSSQHPPG